jgi:molybdopterin biosynthesis enzyme
MTIQEMTFSQWRYRVIEQILCRKDLPPIARVAAYGIASRTNKTSRTTCSSPMTIAEMVPAAPRMLKFTEPFPPPLSR